MESMLTLPPPSDNAMRHLRCGNDLSVPTSRDPEKLRPVTSYS
jgi:hypothetical protein